MFSDFLMQFFVISQTFSAHSLIKRNTILVLKLNTCGAHITDLQFAFFEYFLTPFFIHGITRIFVADKHKNRHMEQIHLVPHGKATKGNGSLSYPP